MTRVRAVTGEPSVEPLIEEAAAPGTEARPAAIARLPDAPRSAATSLVTATVAPPTLGPVRAPAPVRSHEDVIRRVRDGQITIRAPMNTGAALGEGLQKGTVRPGTFAVTTITVRDGVLETGRTGIRFENERGEPTTLDGPLFFDPKNIYVENGRFYANVPCFPDPDVTEHVLGKGNKRIPDSVLELMEQLTNAQRPRGDDPRSRAMVAIDLSRANFDLRGELSPGAMRLGDGSVINVAGGTRLSGRGSMSDMQLQLDANIGGAQLAANGARLQLGRGRVTMNIASLMTQRPNLEMGDPTALRLDITQLDVSELTAEVPTAGGAHRVALGRVATGPGTRSLVDWRAGTDGGAARLRLDLPELALEDVRGEVAVNGADRRPSRVRFGRDADSPEPMSFRGSLRADSDRRQLELDAHFEGLSIDAGPTRLAEGDAMSLGLSGARLTGAGRLRVRVDDGAPALLDLESREGAPLRLRAALEPSRLGHGASTLRLLDGSADIALERLRFAPGAPPTVRGSAQLDVGLGATELVTPEGQRLQLAGGARATLAVPRLTLDPDAPSPELEASLRLQLPPEVRLSAPATARTPAADLIITSPGQPSVLEASARVSASGEVALDARIAARDLGVQLRTNGAAAAPTATLPRARVPVRELFDSLVDPSLAFSVPTDEHFVTLWNGLFTRGTIGRRAGTIRAHLEVRGGQIVPEGSSVVLDPPLELAVTRRNLTSANELHTSVVRGFTVQRDASGLRLYPQIEWRGAVPDALRNEYLEQITRSGLGDLMTSMVFGQSRIPSEARAARRLLEQRLPPLPEHLEVGGDEPLAPPRLALPDVSSVPAMWRRDAEITLRGIHLERAELHARTGLTSLRQLDLGNGQALRFREGTMLRLDGSPTDFTLEGAVNLEGVRLGEGANRVELGQARARFHARVLAPVGAPPSIELVLSDIDVAQATLGAQTADARARLHVERLRGSTIRVAVGPQGLRELDVRLSEVDAQLSLAGARPRLLAR